MRRARARAADLVPATELAPAPRRRSLGPIAIERNHLSRVAHVAMQTEGRDTGSAARELEENCAPTRAHA